LFTRLVSLRPIANLKKNDPTRLSDYG